MVDDSLPEHLLTAAKQHRVLPFAGAGVSMAVTRDTGQPLFPSWRELLADGAKWLRANLDADHAQVVEGLTNLGKFPDAATVLKEGLGGLFADWIRQALQRSYSEVALASLELPRVLWDLGSNIVLTTNYDLVLRWSCPLASDLEEWSRLPPISSADEIDTPTVWHLHGSVRAPTDLVFSEADYRQLYEGTAPEAERFKAVFRNVLRNRTLLFVGFSFDDAYLRGEMAWLHNVFPLAGGRHYLLVSRERFDETRRALRDLPGLALVKYESHGAPLMHQLTQLKEAATPVVSVMETAPRLVTAPSVESLGASLGTYLNVAQQVNGLLRVPGIETPVPTERVWIQPTFITDDGETPLHRILARRAVVLESPPGAGKSTLAQFVAAVLARDRLKMPCAAASSWQLAYLGVDPGDVTEVPLLLSLSHVDPYQGIHGVFRSMSPPIEGMDLEQLMPLLERGEVAFLIDGLDEVEASSRAAILNLLLRMRAQWPHCYFLVTTRPTDVSLLTSAGFARGRLAALGPGESDELLRRWAAALFPQPGEATRFLARIRTALARTHELRPMLNTPLSVMFLCWNYRTFGTLPTSKASLYDSITEWLLESRRTQRLAAGIDTTTSRSMLEAFAYLLLRGVAGQGPGVAADERLLLREAAALLSLDASTLERVCRVETALGSCLVQAGGRISFWHVNFRDYFAAWWLVRQQAQHAPALAPDLQAAIWNPAWHECIDTFVGLLAIHHTHLVSPLLGAIGASSAGESLKDRIRRVALQSRVLDLATAHGFRPDPDDRDRLVSEFKSTMNLSDDQLESMPVADRISSFAALGALQLDERLHGKPTKRAKPVATGSPILMGQYPVTVQEFARFYRSGAYEEMTYRSDFRDLYWKYQWKAPLAWDVQKFVPNAPMVGVSWHEATAYCRWLTDELGGDFVVRLPTEAEWRQIAGPGRDPFQGDDRRNIEVDSHSVCPVGIFPERRGPAGHDDLGMIWEWLGPAKERLRRRKRMQITADGRLRPVTRRARGIQRSPIVGFRVVFQARAASVS